MAEHEEKAVTIDDEELYGKTPQHPEEEASNKNNDNTDELYGKTPQHPEEEASNKNNDNTDELYVNNDVIATTITRCMRYHRPFDLRYKVLLPSGKDVKYTKIRYVSMEHCALIVVNDEQLMQCNLASPKVKLTLNTYISEQGDISNLSGRKSLIKLLCDNIVRRARDPLATTSPALGLMNSKIFSLDIWSILFGFMHWKDLVHFGYCSQLAYNISNDPEIWKVVYEKEFGMQNVEKMTIANWKNKFMMQYMMMRQKSGTDQATLDLIRSLMQQ
eukprot:1034850_1